MNEIEPLLVELKELDRADAGPFPYDDCRKLQTIDRKYASLIPDLDFYLSEHAGYRSWGRNILKWPDEKIEEVLGRIDESFFDRFPIYAALESQITSSTVPDLHARME